MRLMTVLARFRDKPMCDVKVMMKALDFWGFAEALDKFKGE